MPAVDRTKKISTLKAHFTISQRGKLGGNEINLLQNVPTLTCFHVGPVPDIKQWAISFSFKDPTLLIPLFQYSFILSKWPAHVVFLV